MKCDHVAITYRAVQVSAKVTNHKLICLGCGLAVVLPVINLARGGASERA